MKLIRMRFGAPDKFNIWTSGNYKECGLDNTNLVDYSDEELIKLSKEPDVYILPADEGDIKRANLFKDNDPFIDQSFILLPLVNSQDVFGEKLYHVIDYNKFVPKNSKVYEDLPKLTIIDYPKYCTYTIEEFKRYTLNSVNNIFNGKAIKSTTGSGSRGVWLIDPNRIHLGGKYVDRLNQEQLDSFIEFCEKEGCDIIVQDLIKGDDLLKVNVDFIIRDGKLLGYKWDEVNQSQQFTNWDNGYFIRNEYTDQVMKSLVRYLTNTCEIVDAIMNFEAFSDNHTITNMIEFNWRYSNSMFEWQALGIDPIQKYIDNESFIDVIPLNSRLRFNRYWQCMLYKDNEKLINK